jgi:biotin carboxylase
VGARAVERVEGWRATRLPEAFFALFDHLCRAYAEIDIPSNGILVERLVRGRQATVEGVRQHGRTHVLGVVDSVYRADVPSFARFEYPSSLSDEVQERMSDIARRAIEAIGYDDGGFNVEVTWDAETDRVWIIEVNPRSSSQFADLFEKVDGVNPYALLLDLARGRPILTAHRRGRHRFAASCVLRRFSNARVERAPTAGDLARALEVEPDARIEILVAPGQQLSDELQDGSSFRYGVISVGGDDRADALRRSERIESKLPFHFRERSAIPPHASNKPTMRDAESFSSNQR